MSAHYMIGQVVGDYLIEAVLGEGGMGVVFRAVHQRLGQIVAIKMLHPNLVQEERLKSRFVREAQALARLNHPNIIRLLNFVNRQDSLFIVMEFMEGRGVDQVLEQRGPLPEVEAAEIYQQVLAALHYAHSLGIIHRDIKPSNLAVLDNGGVKVLDFGTAKILGEQKLTQEGMTLGTLIYMSPEQICGRELDHRSDIYSLGVTLYEMVTNNVPHYCEDEMELVREVARGVPDPPSKYLPQIKPEFERIINRSIEKDPAKRYQTADEFLKDINAFLASQRGGGGAGKVRTPPGEHPSARLPQAGKGAAPVPPAESARKPNVGLLVIAACLLVAGLAAGLILVAVAKEPALATVTMALGVGLALFLGAFAFKGLGGAPTMAVAEPPRPVFGEATIALEDHPKEAEPAPPPPGMLAPAGGAPPKGGAPLQETERDLPPFPGVAGPGAPAAYLYGVSGPDQGRSWPLPYGAVTIGRGPHNTIQLEDGGVSTTHAQIGFDGQQFVLTDLQSRNGCFVNSQRISVSPLRDRDTIHLGTGQFGFALAPSQPS